MATKGLEITEKHIMLRGLDLWAVCFIGAHVIDRAMMQDELKAMHMLAVLRSGRDWNGGKKGDFKGTGGRAGALEISRHFTRGLQDENRMSTRQL